MALFQEGNGSPSSRGGMGTVWPVTGRRGAAGPDPAGAAALPVLRTGPRTAPPRRKAGDLVHLQGQAWGSCLCRALGPPAWRCCGVSAGACRGSGPCCREHRGPGLCPLRHLQWEVSSGRAVDVGRGGSQAHGIAGPASASRPGGARRPQRGRQHWPRGPPGVSRPRVPF